MNIPKIIQQQLLQLNPSAVLSWGISKWYKASNTMLAIRVHARYLNGFVCIELDESQDLYDISFCSNKDIKDLIIHPIYPYETIKGVYFDQMVDFIDNRIERVPNYKY